MPMEKLDKYADGRVFTGQQAVELGFADKIGTFEDAKRALGEATGLGKDPEVFKPRKRKGVYALFEDSTESDSRSHSEAETVIKQVFHPELRSKPLFLMPGAVGL